MPRSKPVIRALDVQAGFALGVIEVGESVAAGGGVLSDTVDQVPNGYVGVGLYATGAGVLFVDTAQADNQKIPLKAGEWFESVLFYRLRLTGKTASGPYFIKLAKVSG